jgi:hypothetical protein
MRCEWPSHLLAEFSAALNYAQQGQHSYERTLERRRAGGHGHRLPSRRLCSVWVILWACKLEGVLYPERRSSTMFGDTSSKAL